ncbi:MAG: helix-turn-helix transcriptional regulator [Thermodesulfobacteriota bacterium]
MKKLQCAKCGIVFWTELQIAETLIQSGEWVKNSCPKCGWEWAIVAAGTNAPRTYMGKKVKHVVSRKPMGKEAAAGKPFTFTAARLKSLRRKLGLSQRDLGKLIDVTPWAIVSWEKGRFSPRKDRIAKLSELVEKSKEEVKALLAQKNPISPEKKDAPSRKPKRKKPKNF